jgi:hypothetical protein
MRSGVSSISPARKNAGPRGDSGEFIWLNRVMEVPAAGMGTSGADRAMANPINPLANLPLATGRNPPIAGDSIAALLSELSQLNLTQLLRILEAPLGAADVTRVDDLLRAAVDAIATQNPGHALDLLRQLANIDPARAETLSSNPSLASIRSDVEQLVNQLTGAAKLHAEGKLAEAGKSLDIVDLKSHPEVRPEIFLLVATKLLDAGGLGNYVRSADVSAALLDQSRWAPAQVFEPAAVYEPSAGWQVSLRLLISIWISLGIVGVGLCWWLRDDYLSTVAAVWAAGLILLAAARFWRSPRRS